MLQAAKRRDEDDVQMTMGFIRHALDEYKHTEIFLSLLMQIKTNNKLRFLPKLVIDKGYINPKRFLFEKLNLNRFAIFIGVNEKLAYKIFGKLKKKLVSPDVMKSINVKLDSDEYIEIIENSFDIILSDEKRHAEYAFKHCERNVKSFNRKLYIIFETVSSKVRVIYAAQETVNRYIATSIHVFVIALTYLMRNFVVIPTRNNKNLLDEGKPLLMI